MQRGSQSDACPFPSPDTLDLFRSSIWVDFDLNTLNQQEKWLDQFIGRPVRITGKLAGPNPPDDACGHMSLWPVEMLVTSIAKVWCGHRGSR